MYFEHANSMPRSLTGEISHLTSLDALWFAPRKHISTTYREGHWLELDSEHYASA